MGIAGASPSEALFTRTQRRVLGLLYGHPERSFYANEIVRHAGAGIGAVQRELERLAAAGLLTVAWIGNQKHYQANRHSPVFREIAGLVKKTINAEAAPADYRREALAPAPAMHGPVASSIGWMPPCGPIHTIHAMSAPSRRRTRGGLSA